MSDGLYGLDCMVKKQSEVLSDQTNTESKLNVYGKPVHMSGS
jgi:hypothetical protein